MATNIQQNSQTELKTYLEERLRTQFPSASSQDIVNAAEVAMGRRGYVLHVDQRDQQQRSGQQNDQQRNSQQNDQQQRNSQQNDQQQRNSQQNDQQRSGQQNDQQRNSQQNGNSQLDSARRDNQQGQQQALASVVSVREAAISAAQAISEPTIKMAAIASAWVAFATTNAAHEHSQQKLGRN